MNTDTNLCHLEAALRELEPKVKAQCDMNTQQTMTFAITSLVSLRTSLCQPAAHPLPSSERAVSDDTASFMTREWCMAMARAEDASEVRALITRGKSALENWGRHHPWCGYTNTPPASCNCGLARELAALVVPSPGIKGSDNG